MTHLQFYLLDEVINFSFFAILFNGSRYIKQMTLGCNWLLWPLDGRLTSLSRLRNICKTFISSRLGAVKSLLNPELRVGFCFALFLIWQRFLSILLSLSCCFRTFRSKDQNNFVYRKKKRTLVWKRNLHPSTLSLNNKDDWQYDEWNVSNHYV